MGYNYYIYESAAEMFGEITTFGYSDFHGTTNYGFHVAHDSVLCIMQCAIRTRNPLISTDQWHVAGASQDETKSFVI